MTRPTRAPRQRPAVAALLVAFVGLVLSSAPAIRPIGPSPAFADQTAVPPPILNVGSIFQDQGVNEPGQGETAGLTFVVYLDRAVAPGDSVTVDYRTEDGSATAPADYVALPTATLTFAAGEIRKEVTVTVNGDDLAEADESFYLVLDSLTGAQFPGGPTQTDLFATGTIHDDDLVSPVLDVASPSVIEGDAGDVTMTFVVTLDRVASADVSVDYATLDGSATAADDYVAASGTLTIPAGQTQAQIDVTVHGDTLDEGDSEYLYLVFTNLSGPAHLPYEGYAPYGQIFDDDPTPTPSPVLDVASPSVIEGDAGDVTMTFVVTLDRVASADVSVDYATLDGSATAADDYVAASGTLTIPAGQTQAQIDVTVHGDTLDEGDSEYLYLVFTNLSGPAHLPYEGYAPYGQIFDDDPTPTPSPVLDVASPSVIEGDAGDVTMTFVVTLDRVASADVSVDYATLDGSATAADDYVAASGTLTIPAGQTQAQIDVTVHGDTLDEGDSEYLYLVFTNLSGPAHLPYEGYAPYGQIFDDDGIGDPSPAPVISVHAASAVEGAEGTTTTMHFAVSLDRTTNQPVSFHYQSFDVTASSPDDYVAVDNTLIIPAGELSAEIDVTVNGDNLDEGEAEYLYLFGDTPVNATFCCPSDSSSAYGTILDDELTLPPAPVISVHAASAVEGAEGTTTTMHFAVSLDRTTNQPVSFHYQSFDVTASSPDDYVAVDNTLIIPAGELSAEIDVTVNGDNLDEGEAEYLYLFGDTPVNATFCCPSDSSSAYGTILDDELTLPPAPVISVHAASAVEGAEGTTTTMHFAVSLDRTTNQPVSFHYQSFDVTASSPDDYVAVDNTLIIPAGELSAEIDVTVNGDNLDEGEAEYLYLFGDTPVNATFCCPSDSSSAYGTIYDDDPHTPRISIGDATVVEGDSGTSSLSFTVVLDTPSASPVSVDYQAIGIAATSGTDFEPTSGTLDIAAGESAGEIIVPVISDLEDEGTGEDLYVVLSNPTGGALTFDDTGYGFIYDDDEGAAPTISIGDASVAEGDSGPTTLTFPVTLSETSAAAVTVDFATLDGTATVADGDYEATSGTLTFDPGETLQFVDVTVNGDTTPEPDEDLSVELSAPTNGTILDGTGTGTILDDDATGTASLSVGLSDTPDPVTAGETLRYTASIGNDGPEDATNVQLTDTLPAGVVFIPSSGPCTEAAGQVTCNVGQLAAGTSTDVTIYVSAPSPAPGSPISNAVFVTADQDPSGASASESTTVQDPAAAPDDASGFATGDVATTVQTLPDGLQFSSIVVPTGDPGVVSMHEAEGAPCLSDTISCVGEELDLTAPDRPQANPLRLSILVAKASLPANFSIKLAVMYHLLDGADDAERVLPCGKRSHGTVIPEPSCLQSVKAVRIGGVAYVRFVVLTELNGRWRPGITAG